MGKTASQPIPKHLHEEFYSFAWELAWSGQCHVRSDYVYPDGRFGEWYGVKQPFAKRHGLVVLWCTACGFRFNELANLELVDVDCVDCTVIKRSSKGGRTVKLNVNPELIECTKRWLSECRTESKYLLPNRFGRPLNTNVFNRDVAGPLGQLFGIKITTHSFRDTAADLAQGQANALGLDVRAVQRVLGHTSAATTEIYLAKSAPEPVQIPLFGKGSVS